MFICHAIRQLHLKDGTIHCHEPRNSTYPGQICRHLVLQLQPLTVETRASSYTQALSSDASTATHVIHASVQVFESQPLDSNSQQQNNHSCSVTLSHPESPKKISAVGFFLSFGERAGYGCQGFIKWGSLVGQ